MEPRHLNSCFLACVAGEVVRAGGGPREEPSRRQHPKRAGQWIANVTAEREQYWNAFKHFFDLKGLPREARGIAPLSLHINTTLPVVA